MYNPDEPIVTAKKAIIDFLKNLSELSYVDIIENYPSLEILPLKKPLISLGRSKAISEEVAFNNYLGESYDNDTQLATERIGKLINIYFDVHLWNSTAKNMGGEREIERLEGKLIKVFELKEPPNDIEFVRFDTGDINEDPEEDVFHCRCVLQVKTLLYEDSTDDAIEDFILKGSVINE